MIDLYTWPTPNGHKIHIMLEETGLDYRVIPVDINKGEQFEPAFLEISPNNKMPAIVDRQGPGGAPISLFESGAILIYLAEKTGQFMPTEPRARYTVLQWLMFQMGGIGPMFGQLGFFTFFAGKDIEDPRPAARYIEESARLLEVLDGQLEGQDWVCGDYSIADIAIAPWLRIVRDHYKAGDLVDWDDLPNVEAYLNRFLERPAVQAGLKQPPRD
ncbi:MAG: glutathione S-transferase N-terminal domain-containing protein [Marinosulfonomonas sp.]|nr:glutathione S-transferase N-terminal domain-containing protein [Marinosulfonomonas sp.]